MPRLPLTHVILTVLGVLTFMSANITRSEPLPVELPTENSVFPLEVGWITDLGQPPTAPPSFDALRAYIPLRNGSLIAVRLSDGTPIWTVERPTPFSPATGEDTVIIAADRTLTALRGRNGTVRWSIDVGSRVSATPLWAQGWLIALLENGDVVAIRGADGDELWRLPLNTSLLIPPAVGGTELFVPVVDGRIVAVDLQTGQRLWERLLGGSPQEILALDALFVGATDNYFYRLSRRDGHVEWRWRTGGDIVGRPRVDLEHVFFLSLDNVLRALDRNSGVQRWRSILRGRPRSGPALIGGAILVSGISPDLRTFDALSGEPSNILMSPGELLGPPYVPTQMSEEGPKMVLTTADGRLVGLRPATSPPQLSLTFPPRPLLAEPPLLTLADIPPFETLASFRTPAPTSTSAATVQPAGFSVQVAAIRSSSAAAALASRLIAHGFSAYVIFRADTTDQLYKVLVGRGLNRSEAEGLATRLSKEQYLDTHLVKQP